MVKKEEEYRRQENGINPKDTRREKKDVAKNLSAK